MQLTGDQKTVLRAGYGVFYNPSWSNIEGQFAIYQPFTRIIDINAPPSTANPWANFPGGNPHPYTPGQGCDFRSTDHRTVVRAELQRVDDAAVEHQYSARVPRAIG